MTLGDELTPQQRELVFKMVEVERGLPLDEQGQEFHSSQTIGKGFYVSYAGVEMSTIAPNLLALDRAEYVLGDWLTQVRYRGVLTNKALRLYDSVKGFVEAVVEEKRTLVEMRVKERFPEITGHLEKAYAGIWVEQPNDDWSGVAHDCQGALVAFANKIYSADIAQKTGDEQPGHQQYEKKMLLAIKAVAGGDSKIGSLLIALNDYQDSLRHDRGKPGQPPTTQSEAKRIVLFTYLVIAEVYELLNPTE